MSHLLIRPLIGLLCMVVITAMYLFIQDSSRSTIVRMEPVKEPTTQRGGEEPIAPDDTVDTTPTSASLVKSPFLKSAPSLVANVESFSREGNTESLSSIVAGSVQSETALQREHLIREGYTITNEFVDEAFASLYGKKQGSEVNVSISKHTEGSVRVSAVFLILN